MPDPERTPPLHNDRAHLSPWGTMAIVAALVVAAFLILIATTRRDGTAPGGRNSPRAVTTKPTEARVLREPRIVSLLPSATEILVSMGCIDHVAGVSNYDDDPAVAGLPRVGDYQTTDWEKIASLHPQVLVTHFDPKRLPEGFVQRADAMGARRLNLLTETLDGPDESLTIYGAIRQLGQACNEPAKAQEAATRLRARVDAVRQRVAGARLVAVLVIIGDEGTMAAGEQAFYTELLRVAGGRNVASALSDRYPKLDREQIVALRPEVVLQLLPGAAPQVREQARRFWATLPNVPAVRDGRVVQCTQWYALLPGCHAADLAEQFAEALHPEKTGKGSI